MATTIHACCWVLCPKKKKKLKKRKKVKETLHKQQPNTYTAKPDCTSLYNGMEKALNANKKHIVSNLQNINRLFRLLDQQL